MSMSPEVDLGQIEGAFVMALGLWTSEQIKFDPETGRLLTRDTWVSQVFKGFWNIWIDRFDLILGIQAPCQYGHS